MYRNVDVIEDRDLKLAHDKFMSGDYKEVESLKEIGDDIYNRKKYDLYVKDNDNIYLYLDNGDVAAYKRYKYKYSILYQDGVFEPIVNMYRGVRDDIPDYIHHIYPSKELVNNLKSKNEDELLPKEKDVLLNYNSFNFWSLISILMFLGFGIYIIWSMIF